MSQFLYVMLLFIFTAFPEPSFCTWGTSETRIAVVKSLYLPCSFDILKVMPSGTTASPTLTAVPKLATSQF